MKNSLRSADSAQDGVAMTGLVVDAVTVDVADKTAAVPPHELSTCMHLGRLVLHNPLTRLLGWALTLALVPVTIVLFLDANPCLWLAGIFIGIA